VANCGWLIIYTTYYFLTSLHIFIYELSTSYRLADMKEITTELRRRIETEENERRVANQQNQLK